jgi:peptidoglycan hydrolase CwlO-like protein
MFSSWFIGTLLVSVSMYLFIMMFYYRSLLNKEKRSSQSSKDTLRDAEIIIRKYQIQLQRSLGNIDILNEELTKVKGDLKLLRSRNSQYRLENDKLQSKIKELEGKIEALL